MNLHDVQHIQQLVSYPSISITLPTHRTAPDNKQDPLRVRNLAKEAVDRLTVEFSKREVEPLLVRLDRLVESLDFRTMLDGLILYVNQDYEQAFKLPFTLKERVVIGDKFFTRDLVHAMHRMARYWTLVLSENPTRLYECLRDDFEEITQEGFPLIHEGPGGEQALPGGFGVRKSAYRDERHRQFFRQVDNTLRPFMMDDPLPLVVVGVDRFLSFFNEVTNFNDRIITTVLGSHDKTSPHELSKLVWPLVKEQLAEQRRQVLDELNQAIGERKFVSTVGEVWRMAADGRGKLLIVEEDYHYPARVDETGRHISPAEDITAVDVIEDAVDEIVDMVLEKQGQVVFIENGLLEAHQRIALILRY